MESPLTWITGLALYQKILLGVAAVALVCAGVVTWKHHYDNQIISKHEQEVTVEVLKKTAPANDKAAETRAKDTIRLHEKAQERTDAIAQETDEPPTDADLALNCHRLREAGYDTSDFPACAGR